MDPSSPWHIRYHRNVKKEVRRLPNSVIHRVLDIMESLEENPRPAGSEKLRDYDLWRLRVGNYRIIYHIDDEQRTVTIYRIRHRRDVYRGL